MEIATSTLYIIPRIFRVDEWEVLRSYVVIPTLRVTMIVGFGIGLNKD